MSAAHVTLRKSIISIRQTRCSALTDVNFGDKLETVGYDAFSGCESLQKIKMPSVRTIGAWAFHGCKQLTDVELPCVETMGAFAFFHCPFLWCVTIPLKDNMFVVNDNNQLKLGVF